ncbi:MAG: GNAT family N-acetyltransferase [Candidatus Korarchaeota archaeon]
MSIDYMLEAIKVSREFAKSAYERRLFIIVGENQKVARTALKIAEQIVDEDSSVICSSNYKRFQNLFDEVCRSKSKRIIKNWETDRILGQTYDLSFIDLRDWLDVMALSRVVGTVRGGGIIVVMLPRDYESKTYYEEIVPPYYPKPPRKIMLRRLIEKSIGYQGVYIFDVDKNEFIWQPNEERRVYTKSEIKIPENTQFPKEIYKLAASQDQVEVLRSFEEWKNYIILLANRGRGKSASIGLGITGYAWRFARKHKRALYVCITSRDELNVEEVFRFAEIAHKALELEYKFSESNKEFESDLLRLEFRFPHRAIKLAGLADCLIIDEVAAIPFSYLKRVINAYDKIVFSGTVHGYEGTGRVFAVRFLKMLDESGINYQKVRLEEPIRYSGTDPIEKWLFDMLFLDAEPAPVDESILEKIDTAKLVEIDPSKYFLGEKEAENFVRSLIGILTTAHYRNNPKDLLLMCDAPHHRIFALTIDSQPLVALQIAEEGGIPQDRVQELLEEAPLGQLIPDNVTRYTGLVSFPQMKGFRIVRIATHPKLQGRGLGSTALKLLEELAKKEGKDWIGASFGANPELLNFWLKNEFYVANLSPLINPKTGEYSAIVIKPLSEEAERLVKEANRQLRIRLLRELRNTYWELETETAHKILKYGEPITGVIPQLNMGDVFRLGLYVSLGGKIEACIDVVDEIVKVYFAGGYNFLSPDDEQLIIKKILQRQLLKREELHLIREIIKRLWQQIAKVKFSKGRPRGKKSDSKHSSQ